MDDTPHKNLVAVIGAGPSGLFAARQLAASGARVFLFNRDIKIGGLAEYGIYYSKYKMKEGLRRQFRQILEMPEIEYFGNMLIGQDTGLSLDDLRGLGFQAILVTVGAQGTKWLKLPGEHLKGVYHAKDLVYHYNALPPFSTQYYPVASRVALVGVGNVMLDIAHWTIRDLKVDEVIAVARRGPAEVKFTRKELETVARNLDLQALDQEIERVSPVMQSVGQDIQAARDYFLAALPKAPPPVSDTRFRFEFLASPTRVIGDEDGQVAGLEVEDTTLVQGSGGTRTQSLGTRRVIPADMVVFCIGDRVDETFGLPVEGTEFVKNPNPRFPMDGFSYECFDPLKGEPVAGMFVAGWARQASSGLVGMARKDGENGADAVLAYLNSLPASPAADIEQVSQKLQRLVRRTGRPLVRKEHIYKLDELEKAESRRLEVEDYKMKTEHEMLVALGLAW
jgi:ferredoxin--NADP+ reductase